MKPPGVFDLHTHTNLSDGKYSPEALVALSAEKGLAGIAITDHDETDGIERAITKGKQLGIEVVPGIELSAFHQNYDVHILGYFIDYGDAKLLDFIGYLRNERIQRAQRILKKLDAEGLNVSFEAVLQQAGDGCIGRPHVAEALLNEGHVRSYQAAFDLYLAEGRPAFEAKVKLSPREAVEIIHQAGGVAGLAHPGQNLSSEVILDVIKSGIDAIEINHPKHTVVKKNEYINLAEEHGLLQTGGSDFHGGQKGIDKLGQYFVSFDQLSVIKKSAEWRRTTWH